jgi:hypothetical protein
MDTATKEYRLPVPQDQIRSIKDPYKSDLTIIHAFVKVCDLPNGHIPDKINPRSHEVVRMETRIPQAITASLTEYPEIFHLINRGCLVLAKKAWYDNQTRTLHFIVESPEQNGMVDGATTDRVLAKLKEQVSKADFSTLREEEIPDHFKEAYVHLEVIAGDVTDDLRLKLADARNTSEQVKAFSLEDLGHGYDWLKEILEKSEFKDKIRYRENDPRPVDIRVVLGLLTLFHPYWAQKQSDPIVAYTAKGTVIDNYRDDTWKEGYRKLAPVVLDILRLYDYIHVEFNDAYKAAYASKNVSGSSKLGLRREVRYINKAEKAKELPMTGARTQYVLTDGWLYPLLASLRTLLVWPKSGRGEVRWVTDPFKFFKENGPDLVYDLVEQSEELGRNPNATGKSRRVWSGLRIRVENQLFKSGVVVA